MKILVLGDIGASASNSDAFCKGEKTLFSEDILEKCSKANIVLLNLEKPLTDELNPLGMCPPDYIAPTMTINGILLLKPTAVTLANNHILDQRKTGLESTMRILGENNIRYVGAGRNIKEARAPLLLESDEMIIGIYACCEKEFSFATDDKAGANVFDPLNCFDDIAELKKACDHLIVLFHGGMQDYPYPTPYQRKVCRKMCEKGADLVVCQHSHIIGCEEHYLQSRIIYGQGNFLLDEKNDINWKNGLMIEDELDHGGWKIEYTPTLTKDHRVIANPDGEKVLAGFFGRSEEIKNESEIIEKYRQLCASKLPGYLIKLSGKKVLTEKIIRRLRLEKVCSRLIYSSTGRRRILDYLYCDSHREAVVQGLQQEIRQIF